MFLWFFPSHLSSQLRTYHACQGDGKVPKLNKSNARSISFWCHTFERGKACRCTYLVCANRQSDGRFRVTSACYDHTCDNLLDRHRQVSSKIIVGITGLPGLVGQGKRGDGKQVCSFDYFIASVVTITHAIRLSNSSKPTHTYKLPNHWQ